MLPVGFPFHQFKFIFILANILNVYWVALLKYHLLITKLHEQSIQKWTSVQL